MPPVPIFDGLADDYPISSPLFPLLLKVKGTGSEYLDGGFKVNGVSATQFNPSTTGVYLIEAVSADGTLKIWKYVNVQ
jgi:hypothetical protein